MGGKSFRSGATVTLFTVGNQAPQAPRGAASLRDICEANATMRARGHSVRTLGVLVFRRLRNEILEERGFDAAGVGLAKGGV